MDDPSLVFSSHSGSKAEVQEIRSNEIGENNPQNLNNGQKNYEAYLLRQEG